MAGHVELFVKESKKRHRQKAPPHEARNLLEVLGHSCTILEDDALAAYLDSAESLLPWVGDPQLQIDRYDARHLLSDSSAFKKGGKGAWSGHDDVDEEALDRERYFDLENEPGTAEYLEELEEEGVKRQKVDGAGYRSVGFSYEASAETPHESASSAPIPPSALEQPSAPTETFQPPYPVPQELKDTMPTTQKHHQVMLHTAKFVHTHGGQTEIVLRVKQGANPKFGFLLPEDPLHPFFRFMVDNFERLAAAVQAGNESGLGAGLGTGLQTDAVSLVAAAYGEDEDESEGGEADRKEGGSESGLTPDPETGVGSEGAGVVAQPAVETGLGSGVTVDLSREAELVQKEGVGLKSTAEEAKEMDGLESDSDGRVKGAFSNEAPLTSDGREQGVNAPPKPAVKFAIAKNPPLAVVRKPKQESSTDELAKVFGADPEDGLGAEAERSDEASPAAEKHSHPPLNVIEPLTQGAEDVLTSDANGPPIVSDTRPLVTGVNGPPASGVNGPLSSGVNEPPVSGTKEAPVSNDNGPSDSGVNGPSASGVNEPPASGVNEPPASGVNEPPASGVDGPLVSGVNEPPASCVNALPTAQAAGVNEPPLQIKRVIEKMVEFIARNGKQFEAAVRKKDESEGRFPFLVPGHTYHAYYATLLEKSLELKALIPGSSKGVKPRLETSPPAEQTTKGRLPGSAVSVEALADSATDQAGTDSTDSGSSNEGKGAGSKSNPLFFGENDDGVNGAVSRRGGLGSDAVRAAVMAATRRGSFGSHTQLAGLEDRGRKPGSENAVKKRSGSPVGEHEPAGLSIDLVRAAVMRATRTPSPSVSAKPETKEVKPSGLGIDAVRLAVGKATRGPASLDNGRSEGAVRKSSDGIQKPPDKNGDPSLERQSLSGAGNPPLAGPTNGSLAATRSGSGGVLSAEAAAAAAAAEEADSSHAPLTAAEKKRAERLKRAKMFSAILRETSGTGAGASVSEGGASGSVGRVIRSEPPQSAVRGSGAGDAAADGGSLRGEHEVPADISAHVVGGSEGSLLGKDGAAADVSTDVGSVLAGGVAEVGAPAGLKGSGEKEKVGEGEFVQLADGSAEEGEVVADGEGQANPGNGKRNGSVSVADVEESDVGKHGLTEEEERANKNEGGGETRAEKEKTREGVQKRREDSDVEKRERRRHKRRSDEREEGAEGSDGEGRRRRRDRTADDAGENREDRRRRRRERRERRASGSERCKTAGDGEEYGGGEFVREKEGGRREREKEERRRRRKERHREQAEPEEGEICEDVAVEGDGKKDGGGNGKRLTDVSEKGGRTAGRMEGEGPDETERGRKRTLSSSREKDGVKYSDVPHPKEAVKERTAGEGLQGKVTTARQDGKAKESGAAVPGTNAASSGEVKACESDFEVPESVRAKVRAMLGFL